MSTGLLLLDVGNSRVKWALTEGEEWLAEGAALHEDTDRLLKEWDRFPAPRKVLASNVAGARGEVFADYWQARDVSLRGVTACAEASGVRNLYAQPQQLGSDRWLALLAAWARLGRACLVVSAGTAVTVDALNDNGDFLGGMILPGRRLMQESLAAGTHALQNLDGTPCDFPRNSADAVASGIATALACAVQTAQRRLAQAGAPDAACILTGGDAEWLAGQLPIGVIIAPRLVLEGLLTVARGEGQA